MNDMLMFFLSLQELRKQTENPELQADITEAIDAIQTVLDAANNAIDKEHLATAVADLAERVDDWKLLKVDSFGELLRFGTFTVVKGDTGKDSEREVPPPPFLCHTQPQGSHVSMWWLATLHHILLLRGLRTAR